MKTDEYDESKMTDEQKERLSKFQPPILFRWAKYPDEEDFDLEVKYLLPLGDKEIYSPWTDIPAVEMTIAEEEEDPLNIMMH